MLAEAGRGQLPVLAVIMLLLPAPGTMIVASFELFP
jgi:hypothetical protein